MKQFVFSFILFGLITQVNFAQIELSPFPSAANGFSATSLSDYQSLSVNPANLGFYGDHKFNLGLASSSIGLSSQSLSRSQIFNDFFATDFTFSEAERQSAIDRFTDTRLLANASVNWLGFSYQDENFGGLAFSVRDRLSFNLILNDFASEMLFSGANMDYFDQKVVDGSGNLVSGIASNPKKISEVAQGSGANFVWYREYHLGYGRHLIKNDDMQLNIGVGVKYIQGFAFAQYYIAEDGTPPGFISTSPFLGMDLGNNSKSPVDGSGLVPVGTGFGFDIGFSGSISNKFNWSLAINDIGSVNWHGNVFKGDDVFFTDIDGTGINSFNLFTEAPDIEGIAGFDWVNMEPAKKQLATNLRAGLSYDISDHLSVGSEVYYPLIKNAPGGYNNPIISGGASYNLGGFEVQVSVSYNEYYGVATPLALIFRPVNRENFRWEFGLASRDVKGLLVQENPNLSLVLGLMRFSF